MTPKCAKIVKVEMTDTTLPVKINFAQRSCQAVQVAKKMRYKSGGVKFEEILTICGLECVDLVLGNTFLHYYEVKVRQRLRAHVAIVGSDKKPKPLPFTRLGGLDGFGINLVTKEALFEEQFINIERKFSRI